MTVIEIFLVLYLALPFHEPARLLPLRCLESPAAAWTVAGSSLLRPSFSILVRVLSDPFFLFLCIYPISADYLFRVHPF